MQQMTINTNGLDQIKAAVKYHTNQELTIEQACAYASQMEERWMPGEPVFFEISQFKTLSGRPEVIDLTEDGYDIQDIEDDK
ncbi:MAG: hypothetical protein Q4A28_07495 [Brachymonas sp.]|nr:hypothetical protein [Brachymonas sp.]